MATLCGLRYLRVDDDFEYATMWATDAGGVLTPPAYTPWDGEGELYYDIEVDNELAGFQLGANMNYCVSCKCNVFWNSTFGMYNNHIEVYQRVYGELGPATWTQTGADAVIYADKDDIAFAGEMLIGTSYNFTCNCRGVLAYRAVADQRHRPVGRPDSGRLRERSRSGPGGFERLADYPRRADRYGVEVLGAGGEQERGVRTSSKLLAVSFGRR